MTNRELILDAMNKLGSLTRPEAEVMFPEMNENSVSSTLSRLADTHPHVHRDYNSIPMRYDYDESRTHDVTTRSAAPIGPDLQLNRRRDWQKVRDAKKGLDIFEFLKSSAVGARYTYEQLARAMGRDAKCLAPAMAIVFRNHAEIVRDNTSNKIVVWYQPGHVNSRYQQTPPKRQSSVGYEPPNPKPDLAHRDWRVNQTYSTTEEMIGTAVRILRNARKERGEGFTITLDSDPEVLLRVRTKIVTITEKEIEA